MVRFVTKNLKKSLFIVATIFVIYFKAPQNFLIHGIYFELLFGWTCLLFLIGLGELKQMLIDYVPNTKKVSTYLFLSYGITLFLLSLSLLTHISNSRQ